MSALQEIQKRAEAATPGPWQWFGNWDFREVYLATVNYGRRYVLGFRRWGMQGAQPVFRSAPGEGATLKTASEVPVFEVCRSATSRDDQRVYRGDLVGFRNADAEFIAHARADVDELIGMLDKIREYAESWIDDMVAEGDECGEGWGCPCCYARTILAVLDDEQRDPVRSEHGSALQQREPRRPVATLQVAGDVL